jgi:hypothetical protein
MEPKARLLKLQNMKKDPSLRFSDAGRALLRWLDGSTVGKWTWARMVDAVPAHCAGIVAELARECAEDWQCFADQLEHLAAGAQSFAELPARPSIRA